MSLYKYHEILQVLYIEGRCSIELPGRFGNGSLKIKPEMRTSRYIIRHVNRWTQNWSMHTVKTCQKLQYSVVVETMKQLVWYSWLLCRCIHSHCYIQNLYTNIQQDISDHHFTECQDGEENFDALVRLILRIVAGNTERGGSEYIALAGAVRRCKWHHCTPERNSLFL